MSKKISLNSLLQIFNLFIFISSKIVFDIWGENEFVNEKTIILTQFFCLFIFAILTIERKRKNPFIILLSIFLLLFYLFRIPTLTMTSFSRSIELSGYITNYDFNYAFLYIFLSSIFLSLGLFFYKVDSKLYKSSNIFYINNNYYKIFSLITISLLSTIVTRLSIGFLDNSILNYFLRIYPYSTIMLFSLVYIFTIERYGINKSSSKLIKISLLIMFLIITLIGGRKFIFNIFLFTLIVLLVIDRKISFKISYIIALVFIVPASIITYDLATYLRYFRYDNLVVLGNEINYIDLFSSYLSAGIFKTEGLQNIADRLGFLDFTVESITSSNLYKPILNPIYYFKSLVDNITPGVELFGTPISGQIKQFIYRFGYVPTSSEMLAMDITREAKYSSQMFSGFAELYIIFGGMASFPTFFIIGLIFVKVFNSVKSKSVYFLILFKSIVLISFYGGQSFLESFGTDWTIQSIIFLLIGAYISRPLFKGKTIIS